MSHWWIKRISLNGFLLIISLILSLIIFEVFLRLFHPEPLGQFKPSSDLGWVSYPHYTKENGEKFNAQGFHDAERTIKKPNGSYRILVLGDSFVEGMQVKLADTFTKLLEGFLNRNAQSGRLFEVINTGTGGYGTDQEFIFLKKYGLRYNPDLVVLGLYVGNDFYDNISKRICELKGGRLIIHDFSQSAFRRTVVHIRAFLQRHSQLYNQALKKIIHLKNFRLCIRKFGLTLENKEFMRNGISRGPDQIQILSVHPRKSVITAFDITMQIIWACKALCDQQRIKFLLLIIPTNLQVKDSFRKMIMSRLELSEEDFQLEKPNQILRAFCVEKSIQYIDILPSMRANPETRKAYFHGEYGHFNLEGHRLVAKLLYAKLQNMNIAQ